MILLKTDTKGLEITLECLNFIFCCVGPIMSHSVPHRVYLRWNDPLLQGQLCSPSSPASHSVE